MPLKLGDRRLKMKYQIRLNNEDMFEMVIDGVLTDCDWVGGHLLAIANKHNIAVPSYINYESQILACLQENGIDVEVVE
jgi:hypothetical protein